MNSNVIIFISFFTPMITFGALKGISNPVMDTREDNDVKFYSFRKSSENHENRDFNDDDGITVMIIHGFQSSPADSYMLELKNALLRKEEIERVVVVDWSIYAKSVYEIAVTLSSKVALLASEWLTKNFVTDKKLYVVGFSAGAHIAGMIGNRRGGKIAKIFGLDPAKPLYDKMNLKNRLNYSDAVFVLVVHTCGPFIGISEPLGHADFYPNNGTFPQPPCQFGKSGMLKTFMEMICSHKASVFYFNRSIMKSGTFVSYKCITDNNGPRDYFPCNFQGNVEMGFDTPVWLRGSYYVNVSAYSESEIAGVL